MIAYNLFHAFIRLNVKKELREKYTKIYFLFMITAEIFNKGTRWKNFDST
jgi:hypothetical protein